MFEKSRVKSSNHISYPIYAVISSHLHAKNSDASVVGNHIAASHYQGNVSKIQTNHVEGKACVQELISHVERLTFVGVI